jgi:hypothetical protein
MKTLAWNRSLRKVDMGVIAAGVFMTVGIVQLRAVLAQTEGTDAAPPPPPPPVEAVAREMATYLGDPSPDLAQFVLTTRRAAMATVAATDIEDDTQVYLVVLSGNFVHMKAYAPHGYAAPTGTVAVFTWDPLTDHIFDLGVNDLAVDNLSSLGDVGTLNVESWTHVDLDQEEPPE